MNVILYDGEIFVDENILNKIPHFISAKHFTDDMREYDLHSYNMEQFAVVLRYLTTGYVDLYIKTNIFDYLQVDAHPLKVIMNVTTETIYPGEPKYVINNKYIELDNEVSYKFKVYVSGLDEYYDIDLHGYCLILFVNSYKFSYDLSKYIKDDPDYKRYSLPYVYSDIYGKELKIQFKCLFKHSKPIKKTIFLTFSSIIPN